MAEIPLLFVGDPHGRWDDVHTACRDTERPGVLVLLGDYGLLKPVADVLDAELATEWVVKWIIGNHDVDTEYEYDNLETRCQMLTLEPVLSASAC